MQNKENERIQKKINDFYLFLEESGIVGGEIYDIIISQISYLEKKLRNEL